MVSIVRKFDRRPSLRLTHRTLPPLLSALILLFFGFVGTGAAAADAPDGAGAVPSGSQLAISDFDGDFHPDLASVQAGVTASGSTDYWIQLQLSGAGRQSIRLVAPAGGLTIAARDVNGDHAVDLVVSTSLRQPVAVFLNDGHGSFSPVAPSAFPEAFSKPWTNWASASEQATDAVGVPRQSRPRVFQAAKAFTRIQFSAKSIASTSEGFALDSCLASPASRAPPA